MNSQLPCVCIRFCLEWRLLCIPYAFAVVLIDKKWYTNQYLPSRCRSMWIDEYVLLCKQAYNSPRYYECQILSAHFLGPAMRRGVSRRVQLCPTTTISVCNFRWNCFDQPVFIPVPTPLLTSMIWWRVVSNMLSVGFVTVPIDVSCRRIGGYDDVILVSSSHSTHLGRPGIQSVTMQMPSPTKRSLASDAIIPSFVIPSNGWIWMIPCHCVKNKKAASFINWLESTRYTKNRHLYAK